MKMPPPVVSLAVGSALTIANTLQAHSGHSHADIPSVIRHPLAGVDHIAISSALGLAAAGCVYAITKRLAMPSLLRWTSCGLVAVAVAVGLS